jgi:hypothetical protein
MAKIDSKHGCIVHLLFHDIDTVQLKPLVIVLPLFPNQQQDLNYTNSLTPILNFCQISAHMV